ncbi:hypothetical protein DM01DRAFT_1334976 [Hesseltinella vesiculosa]|uniref:Uncharacterized protein n=1 Tax=Hesseltinella vesiculosa TaxID=101127 RepID=A0A1X2GL29_9FUNG|nr:hypothetical protein DM01DRAFT_1334976 [Hesseltinella vesiculosa]
MIRDTFSHGDASRSRPTRLSSSYFASNPTTPTLDPRVSLVLQKLIQKLSRGNEENLTPVQYQSQQQQAFDRALQTIATHDKPSVEQDENHIANLIRRQLLAQPNNAHKALRFGHLYNKLDGLSALQNKWSTLYLLHLLSPQPSPSTSSPRQTPTTPANDATQFHAAGLPFIATRPYDPSASSDSPRTRRRLMHDDPNTATERQLPPSVQLAHARKRFDTSPSPHEDDPMAIDIPEHLLLRDLIYVIQGINGQYITFDAASGEYILNPAIAVAPSTQQLIYRLTELGWLYQRIQAFIQSNTNDMTMGLVGQSFSSALQSELMEYYKLIAILEAQIEKQNGSDDFIPNEQSLTLKRLLVWTQESLQRLKLMDILVDVGRDLKGGALVSVIHNYTNHGDPFFRQFITDMLQKVSKPFYDMLRRWIAEGELDDPFEEFFVATDPTVSEEELWQRKYSIREDMLPSFISNNLAQKIFSIGKSLNFIRYNCHDETLVDKYYTQDSSALPLGDLKYGDLQTIEQCVDLMYSETSDRLLTLLKDKYRLMDHLDALKRYLLLGQGDFIQYLMATLGPTLNRPASSLFRHNLTGVLETAIRASNAQYDDPAMLNRLDVRLLEISPQDLGWDVFTLDYHVDSPINTVLSPPAMNQYLRVFNFLWRLKRVEYTLTATWRRWGTSSRTFASLPEITEDLHHAQLIIASMVHFIYQLQHYYLFEVLESSWENMHRNIHTKSKDLDDVISAHSQYLQDITQKGFLSSGKHQPLSIELDAIFDVILTYKTVLDMLYNYGTAQLAYQSSKKGTGHRLDQKDKLVIIHGKLDEITNKFKVRIGPSLLFTHPHSSTSF